MVTRIILLLGVLAVAGCLESDATHKQLVWDSNTEADMQEYRVYACATSPCLASGTPLAVVGHVSAQATHRIVLPHTDQYYVVYAVDTALNASGPSTTVFANVIAPGSPGNVRIE